MQEYEVDLPEGKDLMVLDVLALVKEQDASWHTAVPVEKACAVQTDEHQRHQRACLYASVGCWWSHKQTGSAPAAGLARHP